MMTRVMGAGVEVRFYDEEGKGIEELRVWIRGQLVQVKGSYLLPFSNSP